MLGQYAGLSISIAFQLRDALPELPIVIHDGLQCVVYLSQRGGCAWWFWVVFVIVLATVWRSLSLDISLSSSDGRLGDIGNGGSRNSHSECGKRQLCRRIVKTCV